MIEQKPKIIVVVGPTASGKSDLAVRLSQKWNGEVVSADSRQVYKGCDIGTGKIMRDEMEGIPHHLLDVADPKNVFTVSDFKTIASKAIDDILEREKLPIVCGGTGFYIQALVDGIQLPDVPPDQKLRDALAPFTASALYEKLATLDPDFADIIDKHNPHRLIRAIEIASALGRVPLLVTNQIYNPLFIGIATDLYTLRDRIHERLNKRIEMGMTEETIQLHEDGLTYERMESLGLEYRYLARFLLGKITKDEMITQLENEIFQYAKRQLTWFKRNSHIKWFENDDRDAIDDAVRKHLSLG